MQAERDQATNSMADNAVKAPTTAAKPTCAEDVTAKEQIALHATDAKDKNKTIIINNSNNNINNNNSNNNNNNNSNNSNSNSTHERMDVEMDTNKDGTDAQEKNDLDNILKEFMLRKPDPSQPLVRYHAIQPLITTMALS